MAKTKKEIFDQLENDLREYIDNDQYRKLWLNYVVTNSKKQRYDFVITLFTEKDYESLFLKKMVLQFKEDDKTGELSLLNYDKLLDDLKQKVNE